MKYFENAVIGHLVKCIVYGDGIITDIQPDIIIVKFNKYRKTKFKYNFNGSIVIGGGQILF